MMGEYWIDKENNNGESSFFKMLEGQNLNEDEKVVFSFMKEAQYRYERVFCPPLMPRLEVTSVEKHLKKSSENVLEAFARCCVLTGIFVPIKDIAVGQYRENFSYAQRFAMWKGATFKGIYAYGESFIKETLQRKELLTDNQFELHNQMNVKDFSVKSVYYRSILESLKSSKAFVWNSSDKGALDFCSKVFTTYPDLASIKNTPKKVCSFNSHGTFENQQQKTL